MLKKQNKGFTLMEVLIYTAILSITGTILSGVLLNTTKIKSRQTAVIEVNEQLNFVLQNIQRSIADSSVIDIANGVSTSTLILKFKDEAKNPTEFYISDSIVYKKEAGGTPQPLTDSSVIADAVNFLKVSGYSGHDSVQIDLTLSYNTQNPAATFSRTLSSAIARVSAATFDSNLIPGSGSFYDIGTTALPWNNVYISGSVGIGTTDPSQILDVAGIANVQNYLNTSYIIATSTTATSTLANGISLSGGCFLYNGSCLGSASTLATGNIFVGDASNAATATSTIYLSTASKVGIGTTNPGSKLDIRDSDKGSGVYAYSNLDIYSTDAFAINKGASIGLGGNNNQATSPFIFAKIRGAQEAAAGYNGYLTLFTNTGGSITERMRITSAGNVGIASTTPWGLLSVNPNGITGPAFVIGSSTTTNLIVTNGGNVGIGTTNPVGKLDINGQILLPGSTGNSMVRPAVGTARITGEISSYSSAGGLVGNDGFLRLSAGGGTLANQKSYIDLSAYSEVTDMSRTIVFGTSGTERMRIGTFDTGNVGIGTTAPGAKLQVSGSSVSVKIQDSVSSGAAATAFVSFYGSDDVRNGYVGDGSGGNSAIYISSDNDNVVAAGIGGSCTVNTGGCASDERLKQNITNITGSLERLMQINGISYQWKAHPGQVYYGVIAQNVQSQFPDLVTASATGSLEVNYRGLIAPVIESIKEQQKQIEELKNRINELEAKIK